MLRAEKTHESKRVVPGKEVGRVARVAIDRRRMRDESNPRVPPQARYRRAFIEENFESRDDHYSVRAGASGMSGRRFVSFDFGNTAARTCPLRSRR